jgi:hypothetical protein
VKYTIGAWPNYRRPYRLANLVELDINSVTETKEGLVSRAWGFLFDDPDRTARCTEVHVSYYGESVALERLLKEVTTK